jgi:hypothetical protein
MKEVWRLVNQDGLSYDAAIDKVAAEKKQQDLEYQEMQTKKHE